MVNWGSCGCQSPQKPSRASSLCSALTRPWTASGSTGGRQGGPDRSLALRVRRMQRCARVVAPSKHRIRALGPLYEADSYSWAPPKRQETQKSSVVSTPTPRVTFDGDRALTSFAGLVLFQALFAVVSLRTRLRACFEHLDRRRDFGHARVLLQLVVHVLMGFRRLRDRDYYADSRLRA